LFADHGRPVHFEGILAIGKEPMEWIKDVSDRWVIWLLRVTSRFEKELTPDGREEQAMWREQRMRNLQGLSLSRRQRHSDKRQSASGAGKSLWHR
jgi:hypothetical protein